MSTLLKVNALVRECNRTATTGMILAKHDTWSLAAWADGAWAVRANGGSQGGYIIGIVDDNFLTGVKGTVSPISWSSWKLDRVARSSTSAEIQSVTDTLEELELCRLLIYEVLKGPVNYEDQGQVNDAMRSVPAVLATDGKAGYDALARNESSGLGLKERRAAIECRGIKQAQRRTGFDIAWVHSDAMLGDGLTKGKAAPKLHQFFVEGQIWRLVHDPMFTSARKRKGLGLEALDDHPGEEARQAAAGRVSAPGDASGAGQSTG